MADANFTPLLPRKEAIVSGSTFYGFCKPCTTCSAQFRYVCNGQCVDCTKALERTTERTDSKRVWAQNNVERIRSQREKKYKASRDAYIEKARIWSIENKDKRSAISKSYKARRRQQEIGGDSTAQIGEWENSAAKVCYWCGIECAKNYHADHYQPLAKGGKHEVSNLVIACAGCNLKKNAKDPYKFAGLFGRLF
jgi:5-methylcytosine-specific restriction endonuclease McrA